MLVLIVGASKGIGLETTRQDLDAGHHVRALSRSSAATAISDPRLEQVRGDALKAGDRDAALVGFLSGRSSRVWLAGLASLGLPSTERTHSD